MKNNTEKEGIIMMQEDRFLPQPVKHSVEKSPHPCYDGTGAAGSHPGPRKGVPVC